MMRRLHLTLTVLVASTTLVWAGSDTSTAELTDALRSHVKYLASDSLEGRLVGSAGIAKAAAHIAGQFRDMGLQPAFEGSYYQRFETELGVEIKGEPSLVIGDAKVAYPDDFSVLPLSGSGDVAGPVVVSAGGLPADDRSIAGSIVFCMEDPAADKDRWSTIGRDGLLEWMKAVSQEAYDREAAAVVFVAGRTGKPGETVHSFAVSRSTRPLSIPSFEITYAILERILASQGYTLEPTLENRRPVECQVAVEVNPKTITVFNVGGLLQGDRSSGQIVVVGAHYDHLGYGDIASSTPWRREIHNGADDNASGVAALIELARKMVSAGPTRRSVVFVAFTAEELGAIGSEYYCKNPPYPIDSTIAMINLDTVGRLEDGRLIVFGARSAAEFSRILGDANKYNSLEIIEKQEIYGFSDQNPFYARGIPSLHFFTGAHGDYHSPDDDWQQLNFDGLAAITSFVAEFTTAVAGADGLTPEVELEQPSRPTASRGKGAFLGIIPDFAYTGTGVGIKGAVPKSPAEQAGLRDGDVIVGIDAMTIADLQGLMRFLVSKSPGDTIEIQVMRGSAVVTREAMLSVRTPQRQGD